MNMIIVIGLNMAKFRAGKRRRSDLLGTTDAAIRPGQCPSSDNGKKFT